MIDALAFLPANDVEEGMRLIRRLAPNNVQGRLCESLWPSVLSTMNLGYVSIIVCVISSMSTEEVRPLALVVIVVVNF